MVILRSLSPPATVRVRNRLRRDQHPDRPAPGQTGTRTDKHPDRRRGATRRPPPEETEGSAGADRTARALWFRGPGAWLRSGRHREEPHREKEEGMAIGIYFRPQSMKADQ